MGNIINFNPISEEQKNLAEQTKLAQELKKQIRSLTRGTYRDPDDETYYVLEDNYRRNVNDARKKQTMDICEQLKELVLDLDINLQPKDSDQIIDITFDNSTGQITKITNTNNPGYQLDSYLLSKNQMKDYKLKRVVLTENKSIRGIGDGAPEYDPQYNIEALNTIDCDPEKNCTCTFYTSEKVSLDNPFSGMRASNKLG